MVTSRTNSRSAPRLTPTHVQIRESSSGTDSWSLSAARDFKAAITAAGAVVVATPTYNDSFSGVVKNAVDWASRPRGQHAFNGKVTGVAGASIAPHAGSRGTDALSAVLAFGEAKVFETAFNVFVTEETFDVDGNFADADLRTRAHDFLAALAANVA